MDATAAPPPRAVPAPAASSEDAERERAARRIVQDARAFLRQGRPDAALRATTRGLAIRREDAPLWRARARALHALGRDDEALEALARADALDPPPPPLPSGPRPGHYDDLLLVVQAPAIDLTSARAVDRAHAAIAQDEALETRLRDRLPGVALARESEARFESLPEARRWLEAAGRPRLAGLHPARAFCGESIKDGRFAVASLHRVVPGAPPTHGVVRWTGLPEDRLGPVVPADDPPDGDAGERGDASERGDAGERDDDEADAFACATYALERALEAWLAEPFFDAHAPTPALDRDSVLALLPSLRARIEDEHVVARRAHFVGDLTGARAAYARLAVLDPEDEDIAQHLAEIDRSIELNRELLALERQADREARASGGAPVDVGAGDGEADAGLLPAQLTDAQRAALEQQLEAERRSRDDLLATLAALSSDRRAVHVPAAALRSSGVVDAGEKGPRRALAQLDPIDPIDPVDPVDPVDPDAPDGSGAAAAIDAERLAVRTLHSASGRLIARYYFDGRALDAEPAQSPGRDAPVPILVEEDSSGDGRLDRWTAYASGVRTASWEERHAEGGPDLHVVYADDGETLVRAAFDDGGDGETDRIYAYEAGVLAHASFDTDGDGRLDRFDRFDPDGRVELREEDLTGDGRIDVRTFFRQGRLLRREIMDPAALEGVDR